MRRIFSAVLAACLSLSVTAVAFADTRVIVYPNQNPSSTEQNSNARFARLSVGSFERDAFGQSSTINATTGSYANLSIAPGTGLFVTVAPTALSTLGAGTLYQMGQNDPNPLPTAGITPALAADTTKTMLVGQQTATTSPLGPLTAPGGGQSVYYLIESQLQSTDANPQTLTMVSDKGVKTFPTLNTNRNDQIVYQVKAGTASGSPTQPTVDSGWIAIGYVLVPNGKSQILTGDITMVTPFSGFVQNGNVVHVSPAASPTPDSGNAAVSGQLAANQLVSKVATGTAPLIVSSTTQVANLNAATAGTLSPLPTPTAAAPITLTGTWPNQTIACATCVTAVTGSGNVNVTAGTTPVVTVTAAPTFNNITISNTTTLSALASGCLQVNGSGVVSTTTCASGSGVSSVTGTAPIVSSGGSTPAISCATCVVLGPGSPQSGAVSVTGAITSGAALTGTSVTASGLSSGNCVQAGAGGILTTIVGACGVSGGTVTSVTASGNLSSSGGATPNITITGTPTFTGAVSGTTFNGSLLTATSAVCSDGSKNLTSTCTSAAPTYANVTDSALTSGRCVRASTSGLLANAAGDCVTSVTASAPISSTGGTTPAISCSSCVTSVGSSGNVTTSGGTTPTIGFSTNPSFTSINVTSGGIAAVSDIATSTSISAGAYVTGAIGVVAGSGGANAPAGTVLIFTDGTNAIFRNQGTYNFQNTTGSGAGDVNGGTYTNTSDRRLKKNIRDTRYGLATIDALKPRDFTWKATGKRSVGFIAQEVQGVIPELVTKNLTGYLGVNYSGIVPVLVRAQQEQQGLEKSLAREVEVLRSEIRKLRALVSNRVKTRTSRSQTSAATAPKASLQRTSGKTSQTRHPSSRTRTPSQ